MIMKLDKKPECFADITEPHIWIVGIDNDGPYAHLALAYYHENAIVHIYIDRWAPGILKRMQAEWKEITAMCREKGAVRIIAQTAGIEDNLRRWARLVGYFGFPKPIVMAVSTLELEV